jgi:hypothetical protein
MAETLLPYIAGCVGVLGRGYYVAGPVMDVPGRPRQAEAVLARPVGTNEMPNEGLPAFLAREVSRQARLSRAVRRRSRGVMSTGCHEVSSITFKWPSGTLHRSVVPTFRGPTEIMKEPTGEPVAAIDCPPRAAANGRRLVSCESRHEGDAGHGDLRRYHRDPEGDHRPQPWSIAMTCSST